MYINNFKNAVFLITGFNSGIGKDLTKKLLKNSSKVILLGRKNSFFKKKKNVHYFYCDLENLSDLEKCLLQIKKKFKKINGLVYCAAQNETKTIEKISLDDWNRVISVNLSAPFLICKHIKNNLQKTKNPSIVLISSIAGHRKSIVSGAHYVASKAGILGLARQLSHEFGKKNIRVNCISPSQTVTPMLLNSMSKKQIYDLKKNIPLRRLAKTSEQTDVITFLLSSCSSYIHGASINVDGGQI